jgi:16S rRNA (adenine1518-N6/adenine1519-N6)-dimethyltransferase
MSVKPKKQLGQHFLKDAGTCQKIAKQVIWTNDTRKVLEIGPGMGALSRYLWEIPEIDLWLLDVDIESIDYLRAHYPAHADRILFGDFLRLRPEELFGADSFIVVGNFPYNISSQILFKCLEYRNQVPQIMGMFQKEVAVRVAQGPGSKEYGIISVLLQTFYDIHYCFTVDEHVFIPPPKVKSGVIRCVRNERDALPCDEKLYFHVVKMAFNQRRKTLRNSLRQLLKDHPLPAKFESQRPEKLSVEDFIELTCLIEQWTAEASVQV